MTAANGYFLEENYGSDLIWSLLDSLPVLVCYVDRNLRYRYVNAKFGDWFDLDPPQIVGSPVEQIIGSDGFEAVRDHIGRVLSGEELTVEQFVPYSEGHERYVQITYVPHRKNFEEVAGYFALIQDITQRHEQARAVARSEADFRTIFEQSNCGKARIDSQTGRLLMVNPQLSQMTGFSQTELLQMTASELLHPKHREGAQLMNYRARHESLADWSHEQIFRRKDGSELWVLVSDAAVQDPEGQRSHVISTILDISALKKTEQERLESEERFHTLADNIAQFAWMADGSGSIFWYNRRWLEYTGATLEEMQGWGWTKVQHPDHVDRVVEKITRHFDTGVPWEDTFPLRAGDGSYRWFLSRATPIRDHDGKVVRWFGTNTDITGRLEMEQALKTADRRKDEFLAVLGHELRNPLAAVVGGLQVLEQIGSESDAQREARQVIQRQAKQMNRLVDDLLNVSRIARGKIQLRREQANLSEVVAEVVGDHQQEFAEKDVHCELSLPETSVMARIDHFRIAQVISNLLHNSLKFASKGQTVRVSLEQMSAGNFARISVADSGIGIAPEVLRSLFQPFAQADSSIHRSSGGLGLGLAISKGLVDLHGGKIWAKSPGLEKGSTFVVELPTLSSPSGESASVAKRHDESATPVRSKRVLIIDDRHDARFPLVHLLGAEGHEVKEAGDGQEGIEMARQFRPDAVVCDIGLPGIDGYEVARRLRKIAYLKHVKLIALTGYGQAEDRQDALDAGFDSHLVKPVDMDALDRMLCD